MFSSDLEGHALSWPHLAQRIWRPSPKTQRTRCNAPVHRAARKIARLHRRTRPPRVTTSSDASRRHVDTHISVRLAWPWRQHYTCAYSAYGDWDANRRAAASAV